MLHKFLLTICFFFFFFNCYLAALWPTLGPLSRRQPHSPDVNYCVLHFRHRKPRNKVASLRPVECVVELNREPSDSYYNGLTH